MKKETNKPCHSPAKTAAKKAAARAMAKKPTLAKIRKVEALRGKFGF